MSFISEFKAFISRGNVVDMAVGIIIGAAFTAIVNSLVADVIMPVIGVLMSGIDFSNKFIILDPARMKETFSSVKAAKDAGVPVMSYGVFINALINFLIVAFAVFWLVKIVNRFKKEEAAAPAAPPADIALLTEIRDLLKK